MALVQSSDENLSRPFRSRGCHTKLVNERGTQYWCRTCNLMKLFTTSRSVVQLTCGHLSSIKGYVGNDMFYNVVAYVAYDHRDRCFISQNRDPSVYCWIFSDFLKSNLEKVNDFLRTFPHRQQTLYFTVLVRDYPKTSKDHPHGFLLFDAGIDFYRYFARTFLQLQNMPETTRFRPTHNDPEFAKDVRKFHKVDATNSNTFMKSFLDGFVECRNPSFVQYIEEYKLDDQINQYVVSSRFLLFAL